MLTVTPDILVAGDEADVCVTPANGKPGDVVIVTIQGSGGQSQTLDITLGAGGSGCESWKVPTPGWGSAHFNTPGCDEVTRVIVASGEAGG